MIPIITLIGSSSVGKSSLFNKLTFFNKSKLINKFSKIILDKKCSLGYVGYYNYFLLDTPSFNEKFFNYYYNYFNNVILKSDIFFFILNAELGVNYDDLIISNFLRKINKYIFLIVNKIDKFSFVNKNYFDFYSLGLGKPYYISVSHNYNIENTINNILNIFCFDKKCSKNIFIKNTVNVSIYGKPFVGKSVFINSLFLKSDFLLYNINFLNNIFFNLSYKKKFFKFIYNPINFDFCFKKNKNFKNLFFFNIFNSIIISNVLIFFFDYFSGFNIIDLNILFFSIKQYTSIIFVINKSDLISLDEKIFFKKFLKKKFKFLNFYYIIFISSIKKYNLNFLVFCLYKVYLCSIINFSTSKLNNIISIFNKSLNFNYKKNFLYANQGGRNPPLIIIHNFSFKFKKIPYLKLLEKFFRKFFDLKSVPIKIIFR